MLLQALAAFRTRGVTREDGLGWLPLACRMGHDAWDFESWSVLSARLVDLARETGALSVLPSALLLRMSNRVRTGDLAGADSLVVEAAGIGEATGSSFLAHYCALVLEAFKGRESAMRRAVDAITQDRLLRGEGKVLTATQWAAAVLYNSLGRYEEAYVAAKGGCENPEELGLSIPSMVELVEAAARLGRPADAAEAVERISEMAQATGTDWASATRRTRELWSAKGRPPTTCTARRSSGSANTEVRMELARVRLCYGEWLRGENRRVDARAQLRRRPRDVQPVRGRGVRRTRASRAAGRGRDRAQADGPRPTRPSLPRKRRSLVSSPTGTRTPRSAPGCSSARTRSNGTCAKCSRSSASAPANSFAGH